MSHTAVEIASQPDCWRRVLAVRPQGLPRHGERVAVVGCGTSWFIAMAYAGLREAAGHGETDAFGASEFPSGRRYDRVVAITRSGTTTEVLDLLRALPPDLPRTVLVGDPDTAVVQLATAVPLPFADERSVVQTRFATTALILLRAHLGGDLDDTVRDATTAVTAPLPLAPDRLEQITFLGRGWTVGLAHEAALKCREAAAFWAESYPAMDYRHGPIAIAGPGRAVWAFGDVPAGLAGEVGRVGGTFIHSGLDPLADLILAQRLAVALATHRGLDPDQPRHLTRSVVLA